MQSCGTRLPCAGAAARLLPLARMYQEARCKNAEFARIDECIRNNVETSCGLRCPGGCHAQPFEYTGYPAVRARPAGMRASFTVKREATVWFAAAEPLEFNEVNILYKLNDLGNYG